jgi:uncharacterized protein (TIGR03663 family)
MTARDRWISLGIVLLAFVLRVAWLDVKPAHFDEGVNGWFVDTMTREGCYRYDPTNFHGPLHFYVLFVSQTLFGRDLWSLRMPIALAGTACVALLLAFRAHFGTRACQLAALAMAVSPGFVFYGRYAIHETELVLFLTLTAWGIAGLWRTGERRWLWAAGLGATGAVLTKETYVIHFIALALAAPCLLAYEAVSRSTPLPFAARKWHANDAWKVAAVGIALILFFYSGGFLAWESVSGLWLTFAPWLATGMRGESGHEKEWWYWFQLMGRYEWPALAGFAASFALLAPRKNRLARYLAISGLGALIVYSAISYKTPWCVLPLLWPFYLIFGLAVVRASALIDRWVVGIAAAALLGWSLWTTLDLNFRKATDESEPYVYVQTTDDIFKLLDPLNALVAADPRHQFIAGHVVLPDIHPLPWLLGDFPNVDFPEFDEVPERFDADFLLIDEPLIGEIEPKLHNVYFCEPIQIRGQSGQTSVLYFDAEKFREFFPGRVPEFPVADPN